MITVVMIVMMMTLMMVVVMMTLMMMAMMEGALWSPLVGGTNAVIKVSTEVSAEIFSHGKMIAVVSTKIKFNFVGKFLLPAISRAKTWHSVYEDPRARKVLVRLFKLYSRVVAAIFIRFFCCFHLGTEQ